jgi:hypothetical protein
MGDDRYPQMAWQARTQGRRPKGRPHTLGKRNIEDVEGKRN